MNTESDKNNSIFASIGGKSYMSLVQFFILNYGFINFELHIYVDNDVDNFEKIVLGCPSMGDEELEDSEFEPMYSSIKP